MLWTSLSSASVVIRESTRLAREPRPCCDAVVGRICCCGARGLVGRLQALRFIGGGFEWRAGLLQRVDLRASLKGA